MKKYFCLTIMTSICFVIFLFSPIDSVQAGFDTVQHEHCSSEDDNAKKLYLIEAIENAAATIKKKIILYLLGERHKKYTGSYPHKEEIAVVRDGTDVCEHEKKYTQHRLAVVQKNLKKLLQLDVPLEAIPRIAICSSGGAYRSMVATSGSLSGAADWGLFDLTTFLVGVSGSAWTIASLATSKLSPHSHLEQLQNRLGSNLYHNFSHEDLIEAVLRKSLFNQYVGAVDCYGLLLANKLLKGFDNQNNPNDFYLKDDTSLTPDGSFPLPIFSSVIPADENKVITSQWIEHTPWEVSSSFLKTSIPTWAFGRKFNNGKSIDNPPAQSLGFGLGLWGYAFGATIGEIFQFLTKESPFMVRHIIKKLVTSPLTEEITEKRLTSVKMNNWNYGYKNSPLHKHDHIHLIDAGLYINIGTPPVLRPERSVDIIIVLDNSEELKKGIQLKNTEEYARMHHLKYQPIDYTKVREICSIHQDPLDQSCPIVIYMPMIKNPAYANGWNPSPKKLEFTDTENFVYTPDQVKLLSGLTFCNMTTESTKSAIMAAIKTKIGHRTKQNISLVNNYSPTALSI